MLRNPIVILFVTLLGAVVLAILLLMPLLLLRLLALPVGVTLGYSVAAMAFAGGYSGRSGAIPFVAFPIAFVGSFVGYSMWSALASPPMNLTFSAIYGTIAAAACWGVASWKSSKLQKEVRLEGDAKRRCRACGARVGERARRCWSCRASLNRIV